MSASVYAFIGTYTEDVISGSGNILSNKGAGIYSFQVDTTTHQFIPVSIMRTQNNPSFLKVSPSQRFLYCVNELERFEGQETGAVSAFRIDHTNGELTHLNTQPSHGTNPAYLTIDRTERYVLVGNYGGGSISVFPILADGALGNVTSVKQHTGASSHAVRQTAPHVHHITFDPQQRLVYVSDLGLDKVFIYRFDVTNGTLAAWDPPYVKTSPGAGPRRTVFHHDHPIAYTLNELNSTITVYSVDPGKGALHEQQTISTLPEHFTGSNLAAELVLSTSGTVLYASNRGHNSIATFAVEADTAALTCVGHTPTQGKVPRHFVITPDNGHLIAANQDSDSLVTFKLDPQTGIPSPAGYILSLPNPVCVVFV